MKAKNATTATETPAIDTQIPIQWPYDLADHLSKVSSILGRTDIHLCIMLTPGAKTRYAVRLGDEAHWNKDVNPFEFLDLLKMDETQLAQTAKISADQLRDHENRMRMAEDIQGWKSSKPDIGPAF